MGFRAGFLLQAVDSVASSGRTGPALTPGLTFTTLSPVLPSRTRRSCVCLEFLLVPSGPRFTLPSKSFWLSTVVYSLETRNPINL